MEERNRDDWTTDDLADAVRQADWQIGTPVGHSGGVTVPFRKHDSSDGGRRRSRHGR